MRTAEIGPDLRLGQSQPHSHGPPWQEREGGGEGVGQVGEDPWKMVGLDSTYAVNGFDLLFIFVLVIMLGIKFSMRIMFKLCKLQFRK